MGIGAAVGVAGGRALVWFTRRVPLPGQGLYPLRTLACALLLFAIATLARGSGFLAVFTAVKRQMYGRAKPDLLRKRVLLAD
jgi:cell volume regulation protein A